MARSQGENVTLNDVLQTMDEHYGVVMMLDSEQEAFFPQARSMRKGSQIWSVTVTAGTDTAVKSIPEGSQQEHVEEMKQDCFNEGLNDKYWWMLAHKVNGEHPARYSGLLLAAEKFERWAETRDPLL